MSAAARQLLALLDREHSALRRCDLARLEALAPTKTALLERLERDGVPSPADLEALKRSAGRNARIFAAILKGLRDAQALVTGARVSGQTYRRDGGRAALEPPAGTLHRRA